MMTGTSFIRAELERLLLDPNVNPISAVGLRAALRLIDVLAEHPAVSLRAEALKVALTAMANAYRADWSAPAAVAQGRLDRLTYDDGR